MLYLLPLQSPMVGRILDRVPGHTSIGCSRNFVHLVTGHTPGRINRNGTVLQQTIAWTLIHMIIMILHVYSHFLHFLTSVTHFWVPMRCRYSFQCDIWAPHQYHGTLEWKTHTIPHSFQYHVTYHSISPYTIPFNIIPRGVTLNKGRSGG